MTGEPAGRRIRWLVVAAVLLVQIGVMLAVFNPSPHSGGDNAGYLNLAYSLVEEGAYLDLHDPALPGHTKYPPLFPMILAAAIVLGARSWITFKLLSAVFTTLGVLFAFAWVEERRGPLFAAGVALILSFSDAFLWSSHWILSDPPFVMLTFFALWALDRVEDPGGGGRWAAGRWIALGAGAAVAAYFTRSAGLPLVAAVGGWLLLRRRFRAAGAFAALFGVPAFLWWLRARTITGGAYLSEFLLVNPYQPGLGRAGPLDFVVRILTNLREYVTLHIPGGLTGFEGTWVAVLGVALVGLAGAGWLRRLRTRATPAELFVPFYLGLILLWPSVWSGDRFVLPLYPFLLFYAGEMVVTLGRRVGKGTAPVLGVLAVLAFVAPAGWVWWDSGRNTRACWSLVRTTGAFGCYRARLREFVSAARWSGENLPAGSVVISRKPRLFFTLSGLRGRAYPLEDDAELFFRTAREAGAGYVVVDYLDGLSRYYLVPVVSERAGAFCAVVSWGDPDGIRTELLGIFGPEEREELEVGQDEEGALVMDLRICPGRMADLGARSLPPRASLMVPLLSRLDADPGGEGSGAAQPSP